MIFNSKQSYLLEKGKLVINTTRKPAVRNTPGRFKTTQLCKDLHIAGNPHINKCSMVVGPHYFAQYSLIEKSKKRNEFDAGQFSCNL